MLAGRPADEGEDVVRREADDASATVDVAPDRVQIRNPMGFALPPGGLSIRVEDTPAAQEERASVRISEELAQRRPAKACQRRR